MACMYALFVLYVMHAGRWVDMEVCRYVGMVRYVMVMVMEW